MEKKEIEILLGFVDEIQSGKKVNQIRLNPDEKKVYLQNEIFLSDIYNENFK